MKWADNTGGTCDWDEHAAPSSRAVPPRITDIRTIPRPRRISTVIESQRLRCRTIIVRILRGRITSDILHNRAGASQDDGAGYLYLI